MSDPTQDAPYVDVRNLQVTFTGGAKPVRAVNGVDLQVKRGEVVALIGESGSGKSVTLRSLLRLHPPGRSRIEGQVRVGEHDVLSLSARDLASFRGRVASMIFQEPLLALDPVYSVGAQITEAIRRHETSANRPRTSGRWLFLNGFAFRARNVGWRPTPTKCRVACASAP